MISCVIKGVSLTFETDAENFSPGRIDKGTLAMLSLVDFCPDDRVLDLGCGYGPVGILAARLIGPERVVMCDISERAVEMAQKNAAANGVSAVKIVRSDALSQIDDAGFTWILSNPPYHADFSVPKAFIEKGFNRLQIGGKMVMVTKRKEWYKNKLISIFGGVSITEIDGYYVFISEKRSADYAGQKIQRHKKRQAESR